ncbi:motB family protein [Marinomonas agarivorans]|nr:motB family protein [Marinomonas agarivorans]
MSDEEEQECPECIEGLPAYMGTFADLMSLLMCFFVLLLSFAELDVLKYKQLTGSMREAFGVQKEVEAEEIPTGTSIIALEFSPAKPEPTPINEVRQKVDDEPENTLEVLCKPEDAVLKEQTVEGGSDAMIDPANTSSETEAGIEQTEADAVQVASVLKEEISKGTVEVETEGRNIIIRLKEKGSFRSGSAELNYDFIPVIDMVRDVLMGIRGTIAVEGHTDNIPIQSRIMKSNWRLSAERAISVSEELFSTGQLQEGRFSVTGFAYTRPLVPNDSAANRASNRRVEIVIKQDGISPYDESLNNTNIPEDLLKLNPENVF